MQKRYVSLPSRSNFDGCADRVLIIYIFSIIPMSVADPESAMHAIVLYSARGALIIACMNNIRVQKFIIIGRSFRFCFALVDRCTRY